MITLNGCFQKRNERQLLLIAAFVIMTHAALLLIFSYHQNSPLVVKTPVKLLVQTVKLVEKQKERVAIKDENSTLDFVEEKVEAAQAQVIKKVEPVKKVEPAPKKTEKIKREKAKTENKKQDPQKDEQGEAKKAKQKELLAAAQKNLANIKQVSLNKINSPDLKTGFEIGALSIDKSEKPSENSLNIRERGYRDELAGRLKALLILPERGDIQIKLTLERSGRVKKLVIIDAMSEKNRKYIETAINGLSFPSFQDNFNNFTEYTFLITLK